jgi:hypothetical protein
LLPPTLVQEPAEGWASLEVATAADQLGSAFDGGPSSTGTAVTRLLNEARQQQLAEGNGEDEWALLDLRVTGGRVASAQPDGMLRLEEGRVLPACLSQLRQPVYLQLQPLPLGKEGPGVSAACLPACKYENELHPVCLPAENA